MKKVLLIAALFATTNLLAQDSTRNETFFRGDIKSTGYGAMTTQYTRFDGKDALVIGLYGGWMINHRFMVGLGAYGLLNHPDGYNAAGETDHNNELQMGYGGLMLEYTFAGTKRIHASGSLLLGGGGVSNGNYTTRNYGYGSQWNAQDDSGFYVAQPSVNVEMNMTNWFRIAVGGGYRYVTGSKMSGISDKDMSAPMANVTLKFGLF